MISVLAGHPHEWDHRRLAERDADEYQTAPRCHKVGCGMEERRISRALHHCRRWGDMTAHLAKLGHSSRGAELERQAPPVRDRSTPQWGRALSPRARSTATAKSPIGPRPITTTGSPGWRRARSTPWMATERGSTRHAFSSARAGRQPVQQCRRNRDQLGESAVAGESDAGRERHRAAVRGSAATVLADAARNLGVDYRGVSDAPAGELHRRPLRSHPPVRVRGRYR